jgi:hypothetical protein
MKFWVGVTDNQWFTFLSETRPEEINFWQPNATPPFTNAPIGLPFLFKLKRPYNHIAGGGFFVAYSKMPLSLAWEVFGQKNGCRSLDDLRQLISPLVTTKFRDGEIGCTVLANTFFFEESEKCMILPVMLAVNSGMVFNYACRRINLDRLKVRNQWLSPNKLTNMALRLLSVPESDKLHFACW